VRELETCSNELVVLIYFWILVTLILYFIIAGMFCRIWFLINRESWWSKLVEVLVGFKDNAILNPPTDHIFKTTISAMIVEIYVMSSAGVLLPLHGCWLSPTHLLKIQTSLFSALSYVSNIFYANLAFLLTPKSIIRATTTAIEVLLTFIRFTMTYKTQMVFGDGICSRVSHMKTSTHLLYVFYRDGTLLFIPWVQN